MAEIHGTCDERFVAVRDALSNSLEKGADVGASVAVTVDGELVVDVWGGHLGDADATPWERDTITNVWSTTKTMTALCALMLADAGQIDLHGPVARYWPEFAANGKADVEVRHLLGHTSGLSGWQEPMTFEDLYDWDRATSALAAQAPWWEPGTASGYHAITQGFLVGEVIRRVTGQTVGQFFRTEVAVPLGLDFHIGLAPSEFGRVANVIPPPPLPVEGLDPASIMVRTFANPLMVADIAWTDGWRTAEIPAANGHGNARSVALGQAIVACGGELRGRRFLSTAGCRAIFEEQANGVDLVLGAPLRFGIGYGLPSPDAPMSPNEHASYWGGWGGSVIVVDQDARMTVAYMMNRMEAGVVGDERGMGIVNAAYGALA